MSFCSLRPKTSLETPFLTPMTGNSSFISSSVRLTKSTPHIFWSLSGNSLRLDLLFEQIVTEFVTTIARHFSCHLPRLSQFTRTMILRMRGKSDHTPYKKVRTTNLILLTGCCRGSAVNTGNLLLF